MASSGTYNFNPAASDLVLNAFSKCGKSGAVLTAEHLQRAEMEANLLNVEWANEGVNLWESRLIQVPPAATLTSGTGTYAMPATTVALILAYIEIGSGTATNDRVLGPLSTYEYAAIPNKNSQAPPTSIWFDRQIIPNAVLWPIPDGGGPYTLFCRVLSQLQDVVLPSGVTLDVPWRFLAAFEAGLAERLSVHYAPERNAMLAGKAMRQWELATIRGGEDVRVSISPAIGRYYRI